METIKLQVNKKIYRKIIWLLSQFKDDIKIITEDQKNPKAYLQKQLEILDSEDAHFLSDNELNVLLEERISKYED